MWLIGSYLWSWQRAQPTVMPRNAGADRVRAVDRVLDAVLLVDGAVLGRPLADAQERRGQLLLLRVARQQVAGELPGGELVERHVLLKAPITQSRYGQNSRS